MLRPLTASIQFSRDLVSNHLSTLLQLSIHVLQVGNGWPECLLFSHAGLEIIAHEGLEGVATLIDELVDAVHIPGFQGL